MKRYLNHSWPSDDVLKLLVERFSRQFIYASTVAKYISSICHQPADRLNVVLGIRPPRHVRELPFGELDALYTHIFTSVEHRETVLLILGVRLLSSSRIPQMNVEDLGDFFLLNRGYIEVLLGDLSAVITISDVDQFIHILHTSLGDFLLGKNNVFHQEYKKMGWYKNTQYRETLLKRRFHIHGSEVQKWHVLTSMRKRHLRQGSYCHSCLGSACRYTRPLLINEQH